MLKDKDGCVSLYNFRIQKQEDETIVAQGLERIYRDAAFALPVLEHVTGLYKGNRRFNAVLGMMLKEGVLIKLDQRYLIHREWYETARQKLMEAGRDRQEITLGQYRDCLDASRKIALALLEYFDRQGLTRKNGDVRVLSRTGEKI